MAVRRTGILARPMDGYVVGPGKSVGEAPDVKAGRLGVVIGMLRETGR